MKPGMLRWGILFLWFAITGPAFASLRGTINDVIKDAGSIAKFVEPELLKLRAGLDDREQKHQVTLALAEFHMRKTSEHPEKVILYCEEALLGKVDYRTSTRYKVFIGDAYLLDGGEHDDDAIDQYVAALAEVFGEIGETPLKPVPVLPIYSIGRPKGHEKKREDELRRERDFAMKVADFSGYRSELPMKIVRTAGSKTRAIVVVKEKGFDAVLEKMLIRSIENEERI